MSCLCRGECFNSARSEWRKRKKERKKTQLAIFSASLVLPLLSVVNSSLEARPAIAKKLLQEVVQQQETRFFFPLSSTNEMEIHHFHTPTTVSMDLTSCF